MNKELKDSLFNMGEIGAQVYLGAFKSSGSEEVAKAVARLFFETLLNRQNKSAFFFMDGLNGDDA